MIVIVNFCDIIASPRLKRLDLTDVVKMLRSHIFDILPSFSGLTTLKLGSGSGGVSDIYHEKFLSGVRAMLHLVHFSLTYDCNDAIIAALAAKNGNSLRTLDIEYSSQVTDQSINDIVRCKAIQTLHIFHTGNII